MNKLVKGSIAIAAGAALLIGGAGTFAYWNDSTPITGGTISAGTLAVVPAAAAGDGWTVQKDGTGTAVSVPNISSFVASPGDKFTYLTTVNVTARGNNLVATLSLGAGSIAGTGGANAALAAYLTKTATITATGTGVTAGGTAGTYTVTAGTAGVVAQPVLVSVVINFPKDGAAGTENNTKTGVVTLSGLTVDVNQV